MEDSVSGEMGAPPSRSPTLRASTTSSPLQNNASGNDANASAMTRSTSSTSIISSTSSSSTSNFPPATSIHSSARPSRGRTRRREDKLIVSSQPLNAAAINALSASDSTRKLSKWLTNRGRAKSIGSTNSALAPAIAVSESGGGATSEGTSTLPSGTAYGKRGSISSLAGGSVKSSAKGSREPGEETLGDGEWALEEGDSMDRPDPLLQQHLSSLPSPPLASTPPLPSTTTTTESKVPMMRFSLKKTRSSLKLFGRGNGEGEQNGGGILPADRMARTSTATSRDSFSVDVGTPSSFDDDNSILDLPSSSSNPFTFGATSNATQNQSQSQSPGPGGPNPNVAGRIGGWFSSILHPSPSSSHLPLDSTPTSSPHSQNVVPLTPGSPTASVRISSPNKRGSGVVGGGRLGPLDRMLDKAVQYFLDTDSTADKCEEEIWVLGVRHPGYIPPPTVTTEEGDDEEVLVTTDELQKEKRKSLVKGRKGKGKVKERESVDVTRSRSTSPATSLGSSSPSPSPQPSPNLSPQPSFQQALPNSMVGTSPPSSTATTTTHGWPSAFYLDFYSRIALTYRSNFPPIPCSPHNSGGMHGVLNTLSMSIGRGNQGRTSEGLSSDSGWGCMLRTGQSLLANTLLTVHLGRDWRRPLPPLPSPSSPGAPSLSSPPVPIVAPQPIPLQADYNRLLSLFIDDPSPLAPFSVHRFALMGKQLGKEVGEWFGPSTAAGAIKTLVNEFEPAGLKVCSVVDGAVYRSEVEGVSEGWKKPVLVLIGLRLGIDGVNPIYYESVKTIFSFPQSMGIAGGRPSSSYYFVGAQANTLFYIDPHHPRPAIPIRHPPSELFGPAQSIPLNSTLSTTTTSSPPTSPAPPAATTTTDSFVTVVPTPSTPSAPARGSNVDMLKQYFEEAYPDSAMRSYHCDKVRKMALSSLDPSMLLGFLIKDEQDWDDFSARVKQLAQDHKPIFSLADLPPLWMRRSGGASSSGGPPTPGMEDDADIDSFSEPDDWELDSTNASGASGSASVSAGASPAQRPVEDEDWEDEGARDPSPPVIVTSPSTLQVIPPTSLARAASRPTSRSPSRPKPVPAAAISIQPVDDESVIVIPPPSTTVHVGGSAVLVPPPAAPPSISFDTREEGWEGIGVQPVRTTRARKLSQSPSVSSISSQEQGLYTRVPTTNTESSGIKVAT